MMKRNQTKLKFKEMNLKQRILFVIDWIMRGILMVTIVLFIVAIGMNCADRNKSSESFAYADDFSLYSVPTQDIVVDSGLSNVIYNHYSYSDVSVNSFSRYLSLSFDFTSVSYNKFTFVLVSFVDYPDFGPPNSGKPFFQVIQYLNPSHKVSGFSLSSSGEYYCTVDRLVNILEFQICDFSSDPPSIDIDFNLYIYPGVYSPGFAQGFAAGLEQGKQEGIQSVTDSFSGIFFKSVLNVSATYYDNVSDSTYVKPFFP